MGALQVTEIAERLANWRSFYSRNFGENEQEEKNEVNQMELKTGQLWGFSKSKYCEYSRYLYIDLVKDGCFNCRECAGGDGVYTIHDSDYILLDSRWELLCPEMCYDLIERYNVLDYQVKELQCLYDKARAEATELHSELTRTKSEKRTKCGVLVYINNIPPVFVDGGTGSKFDDGFLYVYDSEENKIAVFKEENVIGASLRRGDDVSK